VPTEAAKTDEGLSETRRFAIGASCAVATVAIWAGWLVAMRFGVTTRLSAADLTALRFATAGVILLPVVLRNGIALDRLGWTGFIAIVIGLGAPQVLLVGFGLLFAPVAHAGALFQGVVPLATACLAAVVLKERSAAAQKLGLLLILVGALTLAGFDVSSIGGRQSIGDLLFLATAALVAGFTVAIRRARLNGLHAAAIAAVASLLIYVPVYLIFIEHGLFKVPAADLVFQALYQGVLTAAISFALYGKAIRLLGASRAAAFIALAPVMATLLAVLVLGEWPAPIDWAAITIVTVGVYLAGGGPLPRRWRGINPTH
jgi:drug/metabolite transporter (DMT)-like permease